MTYGTNRLESFEGNSETTFFDSLPIELFEYRKSGYGIENFIVEFRPVLGNFLAEMLLYDTDIDSVLEDSIDQFRATKQTLSWHKTVNYRCVIGKIMIGTLLKHESRRRMQPEPETGMTHIIDLGAGNIVKHLSMAWRNHILTESWQRLKDKERDSGRPYYSVLRRRYDKPWMSNDSLFHDLMDLFASVPTKQAFRVFLHRCEHRFARNVVTTVAETIHMPNSNVVLQEMSALDLAHFWERLASTRIHAGLRQP